MIIGIRATGRHVLVQPTRGELSEGPLWRPGLGQFEAPVLARVFSPGPRALDVFPFVPGLMVVVRKYAGTAFGVRRPDGAMRHLYAVDHDDVLAMWDERLIPIGDRVVAEPVAMKDIENRVPTKGFEIIDRRRNFMGIVAARVTSVSVRSPVQVGDVVLYGALNSQVVLMDRESFVIIDVPDLRATVQS